MLLEPVNSSRSNRASKGYAELLLDCLRKRHAEYRLGYPEAQVMFTICPGTSSQDRGVGCENIPHRKKQRRSEGWHVTQSDRVRSHRSEERAQLDRKSLSPLGVMEEARGVRSNGCSTSDATGTSRGRADAAGLCCRSREAALDSAVLSSLFSSMDASAEAVAAPGTHTGETSTTSNQGDRPWRLSNADMESPNSQDFRSAMRKWDDVILSSSAGGKQGGYLKVVSDSVLRRSAAQAGHDVCGGSSNTSLRDCMASVPPQLSSSSSSDSDDGPQRRVEERLEDGHMPDIAQAEQQAM